MNNKYKNFNKSSNLVSLFTTGAFIGALALGVASSAYAADRFGPADLAGTAATAADWSTSDAAAHNAGAVAPPLAGILAATDNVILHNAAGVNLDGAAGLNLGTLYLNKFGQAAGGGARAAINVTAAQIFMFDNLKKSGPSGICTTRDFGGHDGIVDVMYTMAGTLGFKSIEDGALGHVNFSGQAGTFQLGFTGNNLTANGVVIDNNGGGGAVGTLKFIGNVTFNDGGIGDSGTPNNSITALILDNNTNLTLSKTGGARIVHDVQGNVTFGNTSALSINGVTLQATGDLTNTTMNHGILKVGTNGVVTAANIGTAAHALSVIEFTGDDIDATAGSITSAGGIVAGTIKVGAYGKIAGGADIAANVVFNGDHVLELDQSIAAAKSVTTSTGGEGTLKLTGNITANQDYGASAASLKAVDLDVHTLTVVADKKIFGNIITSSGVASDIVGKGNLALAKGSEVFGDIGAVDHLIGGVLLNAGINEGVKIFGEIYTENPVTFVNDSKLLIRGSSDTSNPDVIAASFNAAAAGAGSIQVRGGVIFKHAHGIGLANSLKAVALYPEEANTVVTIKGVGAVNNVYDAGLNVLAPNKGGVVAVPTRGFIINETNLNSLVLDATDQSLTISSVSYNTGATGTIKMYGSDDRTKSVVLNYITIATAGQGVLEVNGGKSFVNGNIGDSVKFGNNHADVYFGSATFKVDNGVLLLDSAITTTKALDVVSFEKNGVLLLGKGNAVINKVEFAAPAQNTTSVKLGSIELAKQDVGNAATTGITYFGADVGDANKTLCGLYVADNSTSSIAKLTSGDGVLKIFTTDVNTINMGGIFTGAGTINIKDNINIITDTIGAASGTPSAAGFDRFGGVKFKIADNKILNLSGKLINGNALVTDNVVTYSLGKAAVLALNLTTETAGAVLGTIETTANKFGDVHLKIENDVIASGNIGSNTAKIAILDLSGADGKSFNLVKDRSGGAVFVEDLIVHKDVILTLSSLNVEKVTINQGVDASNPNKGIGTLLFTQNVTLDKPLGDENGYIKAVGVFEGSITVSAKQYGTTYVAKHKDSALIFDFEGGNYVNSIGGSASGEKFAKVTFNKKATIGNNTDAGLTIHAQETLIANGIELTSTNTTFSDVVVVNGKLKGSGLKFSGSISGAGELNFVGDKVSKDIVFNNNVHVSTVSINSTDVKVGGGITADDLNIKDSSLRFDNNSSIVGAPARVTSNKISGTSFFVSKNLSLQGVTLDAGNKFVIVGVDGSVNLPDSFNPAKDSVSLEIGFLASQKLSIPVKHKGAALTSNAVKVSGNALINVVVDQKGGLKTEVTDACSQALVACGLSDRVFSNVVKGGKTIQDALNGMLQPTKKGGPADLKDQMGSIANLATFINSPTGSSFGTSNIGLLSGGNEAILGTVASSVASSKLIRSAGINNNSIGGVGVVGGRQAGSTYGGVAGQMNFGSFDANLMIGYCKQSLGGVDFCDVIKSTNVGGLIGSISVSAKIGDGSSLGFFGNWIPSASGAVELEIANSKAKRAVDVSSSASWTAGVKGVFALPMGCVVGKVFWSSHSVGQMTGDELYNYSPFASSGLGVSVCGYVPMQILDELQVAFSGGVVVDNLFSYVIPCDVTFKNDASGVKVSNANSSQYSYSLVGGGNLSYNLDYMTINFTMYGGYNFINKSPLLDATVGVNYKF